jgi:hypothetical protein
MRINRLLMTLLLGLLLIGNRAHLSAQDADSWIATLYDPATGGLTQVSSSGAVLAQQVLPLPPGFDRYPNRVAIAPGGALLAYVPYSSSTFQGALTISDGERVIIPFNLPLTTSDSLEFPGGEWAFNADGSAFALGYLLESGGWGLIVLNLNSGVVEYSLRSDDPLLAVLGLPTLNVVPVPRRFAGDEITFTLVPFGMDSVATGDTYLWNRLTDQVLASAAFPALDSDTFTATGEAVISAADARLPSVSIQGAANSLQAYLPQSGERFPFFSGAGQAFSNPRFIQNGELILVDSVDEAERYAWLVVGRDGQVVGQIPAAATIEEVRGVGDGFIYTTAQFTPGATTLVFVNTRDGLDAGVPVWTSALDAVPIIVQAVDTVIRAQTSYTPWVRLADPVLTPGSTLELAPAAGQPLLISPADVGSQAAPTLPSRRLIAIGTVVTINTTDGNKLNVRSGPGVGFEIVLKLDAGARVEVVDGPRAGDNFTWWRIRTGDGVEGWAVESVPQEDGTILPTLLP